MTLSLSNQPSGLTGIFTDASGQPATGYYVVVFGEDPKQWFPRSRRVAAVRPRSDGTFLIANLPAGGYHLAAVTDVRPDEWFEPSFLEQL